MVVRLLLSLVCVVSGYFIVSFYLEPPFSWIFGPLSGVGVSLFVIAVERYVKEASLRSIVGGVVGLIVGLGIALSLAYGLRFADNIVEKQQVVPWVYISLSTIMAYLGLVIGSKKMEESPFFDFLSAPGPSDKKLLDTSVIIDGRIVDLCHTGFLEGKLLLPKFVIDELQGVADSADSLRRSRGRRGLDMLNQMKREAKISLEVIDRDVTKARGVDGKLVALAKETGAKILTNDFNLNKVAELQGVKVLNLNELAKALRPVVLPGETLFVQIMKEGKETGQGVGYLDDGTMVVVDDGHRLMGSTVNVVVTSIIQTAAGRMIFAETSNDSR